MTSEQFKAWFEGYIEHIEGCPTDAQWRRIKGRVMELDKAPTFNAGSGILDMAQGGPLSRNIAGLDALKEAWEPRVFTHADQQISGAR